MSVTLKLADEDARLIGNLLGSVAQLQRAAINKEDTHVHLSALGREVSSPGMVSRVAELAGAFRSAVRANER